MAEETGVDYVPGAGDIEIVLHERGKVVLKPTLQACILLSQGGEEGPRRIAEKCLQLNIIAISEVVAAGLGLRAEEVMEDVFLTGTVNIFGACIRFVSIVSNGGRPRKVEEEGNAGEDPLPSG